MTTSLENTTSRPANPITTLPRFPTNKVGPSLLSVIQSAMDSVIVVDSAKHIVLVNQKTERLFGYPAMQLLDKPLEVLMPPCSDQEQRRRMARLVPTRIGSRRSRLELKGIRSNGDELLLNASVSRLSVHGELFLALVVHNASSCAMNERKQRPVRPAELRRWAASSQQANEIEKRRFSKKLYDDIGQRLSVLKLDLDWLETALPASNEAELPERVSRMQGLLDNIIATTKNMASALRPPLLDDFGLLPAVEWIAENFQKRTGIACAVESTGMTDKLDETIESAVFRVVQEGLLNIERHSGASNATLALHHSKTHLDVMIRDDGVGMTKGSASKPGCFGLIAMQERIFVLGGTITIRNSEPHGVTIHASIPIEPIFHNASSR